MPPLTSMSTPSVTDTDALATLRGATGHHTVLAAFARWLQGMAGTGPGAG